MTETEVFEPVYQRKDVMGVVDSILQYVCSHSIRINKRVQKAYNDHLLFVVGELVDKMKEDSGFKAAFKNLHPSGSYWDGLRVETPDEFDIMIIMKLGIDDVKVDHAPSNYPSCVKLNVKSGLEKLKSTNPTLFMSISRWVDENGYLCTDSFRNSMKSEVQRALNVFPYDLGEKCTLLVRGKKNQRLMTKTAKQLAKGTGIMEENSYETAKKSSKSGTYKVTMKDSGPAITLNVTVPGSKKQFAIDIVPAFEFPPSLWPPQIIKTANKDKHSWFVVPYPFKNNPAPDAPLAWRLSFNDHESEMINNKNHLKPIIKILKLLRDNDDELKGLSSYAIKSLFLQEIVTQAKDDKFWKRSLSFLFLHMLDRLVEDMRTRKGIPFFWDGVSLLRGRISEGWKDNMESILKNLRDEIREKILTDPYIVAEILLPKETFAKLKAHTVVGRKKNGKFFCTLVGREE